MDDRKVIQIAASQDAEASVLYALCNDGTVWALWSNISGDQQEEWVKVLKVPGTK